MAARTASVKALYSCLLLALVLLQSLGREVLLVNFTLHRTEWAARYCVNKAWPQLHCDGKCYFAKLAKQQEQRASKVPNSLRDKLEMLPVALRSLLPTAPVRWAAAPIGYGPYVAAARSNPAHYGVFHPPGLAAPGGKAKWVVGTHLTSGFQLTQ